MSEASDIIDGTDLKRMIIRVIMSSSARKINFTLGRISINFADFNTLFQALVTNKIGIKFREMDSNVAAAYDSSSDAFCFRQPLFIDTIVNRDTVLHESIHAIQDIRGSIAYGPWGAAAPSYLTCEAASYVAGALYTFYETGEFYPPYVIDIYQQAAIIAGKIVRGVKTVSIEDEKELLIILANSYGRAHKTLLTPNENDGV